ncbi:LysR family transcriptional regulator [Myxococcota bacterium]|nr:LysR family transcriptional regulator [Myxococcota bacterium]
MRWDLLAVFTAVAETESFSRAAERLGLPRSTVSRQVLALEEELGARLLHRTTRRVTLTPAGRRLLEQVGPHVSALGKVAPGDLDEGPAGTLRITTTPDLGSALLSEVVARYTILHPGVKVEARLTLRLVDLVGEGFDLALRAGATSLPDSPHLSASRIGTLQLGLFASPRYLARAGTPKTIEELGSHDLVSFSEAVTVEGLPPPRVLCDDTAFVRGVLRAGGGLGPLPTFFADQDLATGALVRVLPDWTVWTGKVWLVTPHAAHPPRRVVVFKELLQEMLHRSNALR